MLAAGSWAGPGLCYCCLLGHTADVRHCMGAAGSAVGSPLPHREVANSLAKTLEVGGKEEKLFQEQFISGNESLIQVSMAFITYQHLPTEQHNRLYKGVPELVPGDVCHVLEKQQTRQRRAPLQEEMDTTGNSSLISWLSLYLPGKPPWSMYPNTAPQMILGMACAGWREQLPSPLQHCLLSRISTFKSKDFISQSIMQI